MNQTKEKPEETESRIAAKPTIISQIALLKCVLNDLNEVFKESESFSNESMVEIGTLCYQISTSALLCQIDSEKLTELRAKVIAGEADMKELTEFCQERMELYPNAQVQAALTNSIQATDQQMQALSQFDGKKRIPKNKEKVRHQKPKNR